MCCGGGLVQCAIRDLRRALPGKFRHTGSQRQRVGGGLICFLGAGVKLQVIQAQGPVRAPTQETNRPEDLSQESRGLGIEPSLESGPSCVCT